MGPVNRHVFQNWEKTEGIAGYIIDFTKTIVDSEEKDPDISHNLPPGRSPLLCNGAASTIINFGGFDQATTDSLGSKVKDTRDRAREGQRQRHRQRKRERERERERELSLIHI